MEDKNSNTKVYCFLFGWLDSQDQYVKKYSDLLYSKWGIQTIGQVTMPFEVTFGTQEAQVAWMMPIMDKIKQFGDHNKAKIILYSFSNAGAFAIEHFCQIANNEESYQCLLQSLVGIIFDSGPCYVTLESASHGSRHASQLSTLQFLHRQSILFYRFSFTDFKSQFWSYMSEELPDVPCLYLYSNDDLMCDPIKLSELIQLRQLKSSKIYSQCWDNSRHCSHLVKHQNEYIKALNNFLKDSVFLGSNNSQNFWSKL
eukprot:TRINITY_DN84152_c0_g1_i2.p1 TRINITY_DN84152_c0_g1~~TRINITY_DN84152_c0_g1_i2.p1  ORF type:complete len:290 (-),score=16.20 TRINITY_DN84152_c0_g1_i2:288-1055(-)